MSEAMRCDYCKKFMTLSDAIDWWRIEPIHAHRIGDDDGRDFCSDACASAFFSARLDSFNLRVPGSDGATKASSG